MTDYSKTIEEFCKLSSSGENEDAILKCMEIAQLDRIAESLEGINDKLDKLTSCIAYIPPRYFQTEGYNVFRIAGDVTTG